MTTVVYLVRHGETNGNQEVRYQGWIDNPLNERGERQGARLGEAMKDYPLDAVYTSPLIRARRTAQLIAQHHGLTPIVEEDLRELNGGLLEGRLMRDILVQYPQCMQDMREHPARAVCPGGETMRQLYDRVSAAMDRIVRSNPGKVICVAGHGCVIQAYLHFASGLPFEEMPRNMVANTAISKFTYGQDFVPHLEYSNDHRHLSQEDFMDPNAMKKVGEILI